MSSELSSRIGRAQRGRIMRLLAAMSACLVLSLALMALLDGDSRPMHLDHATTASRVFVVVGGVTMLVLFAAYFVHLGRSGQLRAQRESVLWVLSRFERRQLVASIRRDEVPPGVEPTHLRAMAEQLQRGRSRLLVFAAIALNCSIQAVGWNAPVMRTLMVGLVLACPIAAALAIRDARAADRFLANLSAW